MNNKEITAIALKVFAIYLLAQVIIQLPSIYGFFLAMSNWVDLNIKNFLWIPAVLLIATLSVAVIVARLLWKLSSGITEKSAGELQVENSSKVPSDFHEFIFFVLGLFVLIEGLFSIPSAVMSGFQASASPGETGVSGNIIVWFLSDLLLIILGLSLMFKRKNWVALYKKLKYAATDA